jgi:hypothetical protein
VKIPRMSRVERRQLIRQGRRSGDPYTALRFQAVATLAAGRSTPQVATELDVATSTVVRAADRFVWAWTNARWVTFFYSPTGDSESIKRFLGNNLARTVQCDGTSITSFLERAGGKRPGCWAHARRRLVEAARGGDRVALEGVRILAKLFAVERAATEAGDNADERRNRRQRCSRPILEELREWIDHQKAVTPPKTPLGKGLGYIERQWTRLLLFLEDGNIEATNNRRERELRRLVSGVSLCVTYSSAGNHERARVATSLARATRRVSSRNGRAHRVAVEIGQADLPWRVRNDLLRGQHAKLDEPSHEVAADAGVLRSVAHRHPLPGVRGGCVGSDTGSLAIRLDALLVPRHALAGT